MRIEHSRPIITKDDHPETVSEALQYGAGYWRRNRPEQAANFHHRAQNSWERLADGFGLSIEDPELRAELSRDRDTDLDVSPEELAIALVYYQEQITEGKIEEPPQELDKIKALLKAIDKIKTEAK